MLFQISIKYDPFMNLSVPLPKEHKLITVTIFFKDCKRVPLKVLKVNLFGNNSQAYRLDVFKFKQEDIHGGSLSSGFFSTFG